MQRLGRITFQASEASTTERTLFAYVRIVLGYLFGYAALLLVAVISLLPLAWDGVDRR